MSRTTSIGQTALRIAVIVAVAGLVASAESASAGNGIFQLDRGAYTMTTKPVFKNPGNLFLGCTIGGPIEFRNAIVTNNSGKTIPTGTVVNWRKKMAGQVVTGATALEANLYSGQTASVITGGGAQGTWCQASVVL
jgi:hypothetical protein